MRVALVSEHASPLAPLGDVDAGGQNVHVAKLAHALVARGVDVDVYTRRDSPDLDECVTLPDGMRVVHIPAGPPCRIPKDELAAHMDAFADAMAEHWVVAPPQVAHAHFWMSGKAVQRAAAWHNVPTALTFHALGVVKQRLQGAKDTSPSERLAVERRLARTFDRVLATSNEEIFELRRLGSSREQIRLVPCGVDLQRFRPHGPAAVRTGRNARVVVVSRLVERKGIDDVIRAVARTPGAELVVAGGPPIEHLGGDVEARRLLAIARQHLAHHRVQLLGGIDRDAVPDLLRSADVVVCAPWYEPFGMVALEAMACGIPVVATAVGGLVDTVIDGVTGIHVPPRDPDALARALARLMADPLLRRQMGAAGARRARAFSWDAVARATVDAYPAPRRMHRAKGTAGGSRAGA
jgi:glycosyltransferase involved in cell wall biosynthesis